MSTLAAIQIMSGLLTLATRTMEATIRVNATLMRARAEGREVSDEELAAMSKVTDEVIDASVATLREAAKR